MALKGSILFMQNIISNFFMNYFLIIQHFSQFKPYYLQQCMAGLLGIAITLTRLRCVNFISISISED